MPDAVPLYPEPIAHAIPPAGSGAGPSSLFRVSIALQSRNKCWRNLHAVLSTHEALSVLPLGMRNAGDLLIQPLPGYMNFPVPPWCGIPCDLGRITARVWTHNPPILLNLSLIVRVPKRQDSWVKDHFLLLGSQFLNQENAFVSIDVRAIQFAQRDTKSCGEIVLNRARVPTA
jgi:hypothetical protein